MTAYDARLYVHPIQGDPTDSQIDNAHAAALRVFAEHGYPLSAFMDMAAAIWWSAGRRAAWDAAQRAVDDCMPAGAFCNLYVA